MDLERRNEKNLYLVKIAFQTEHTLLVGSGADEFAAKHGVKTKPTDELVTDMARKEYEHFLKFKTVVDVSFRNR